MPSHRCLPTQHLPATPSKNSAYYTKPHFHVLPTPEILLFTSFSGGCSTRNPIFMYYLPESNPIPSSSISSQDPNSNRQQETLHPAYPSSETTRAQTQAGTKRAEQPPGLSCAACFEQLAGVLASCGAFPAAMPSQTTIYSQNSGSIRALDCLQLKCVTIWDSEAVTAALLPCYLFMTDARDISGGAIFETSADI